MIVLSTLLCLSSITLSVQQEVISLSSYNIINKVATVSGISSGGAMALQVHVAFSSIFNGSGIFAAGPYYCAQGSIITAEFACANSYVRIPVDQLVKYTKDQSDAGKIDNVNNLFDDRTFIFSGSEDRIVDPKVVAASEEYYTNFLSTSNIVSKYDLVAEHTYPTLDYGNPCTKIQSPYLGLCNYDGAGTTLQTLYSFTKSGPALSTNIFKFDQTLYYTGRISLDTTGFLYIPTACQDHTTPCHLHFAVHGCNQYQAAVGTVFVDHAGYNEWAEANNVIIVYPQTINDALLGNPEGCWDWWGYLGRHDYALRTGPQMAFFKNIVDTILG